MNIRSINKSFGSEVIFDSIDELADAIRNSSYDLPEDGLKEDRDYEVVDTVTTEYDFGWNYAEFLSGEISDIEEQDDLTCDIPNDDYLSMRESGIEKPDERKYWSGYNAFVESEIS